jgi:hypothetical protein
MHKKWPEKKPETHPGCGAAKGKLSEVANPNKNY